MEPKGFYKNDGGEVLHGPNFVWGPYGSYHLVKEDKDTYTYPIDGWYWFDSMEEAYTFFGLEIPEE
jgi:hypothetical protein